MKLSVIIPTYNEQDSIAQLVEHLLKCDGSAVLEIIVCDGGSKDDTLRLATHAGAKTFLSPQKGRASQMNFGAAQAQTDVLYFLHADAFPPKTFVNDVLAAIDRGYEFGNFRLTISADNRWVKMNAHLSRLNGKMASGGDQSLFMTRALFSLLGGYREDFLFMEDYDLFARAQRQGPTIKIPKDLQVIDRKYTHNSYLRVMLSNILIFSLYQCGVHPNKLYPWYKSWIRGPRYKSMQS